MKLNTRSRYGLRTMVVLAAEYDKPILLKDIAEHENLSMKYLDNIIRPLKVAGLIRRRKGGYILGRHPSEINAYEIVSLLEGMDYPAPCAENPQHCKHSPQCSTQHLWEKLRNSYRKILEETTLDSLRKGNNNVNKD